MAGARISPKQLIVGLVALLVALVAFVMLRSGAEPVNVVLICVDTLRSDHLSGYGYHRSTTPNLDSFAAEEGIVFDNAYAPSSWTLPSVMSVMTSLLPPEHGVEDKGVRLSEDARTLAEYLGDADWLTAAYITHIYVSSLFGFDRGFLEFRELSIDWNYGEGMQLRADQLNQHVLPWLGHHADSRFFLYLHYFDPHWDYDPPDPYRHSFTDPNYSGPADGTWNHLRDYLRPDRLMAPADLQHTVDLYDGEVQFTDHQLGLLFEAMKALDIWDRSLVVVFGDHGEEFQEHGSVHHIRTLYEEVLRVPLVVKLPGGRPAGLRSRIEERVGLVDIAPTILDLVGVDVPADMHGHSLVPLFSEPVADRDVFAHTLRHEADKMALLSDDWKLIFTYATGRESIELYDLAADPSEQAPIAHQRQDVAEGLLQDMTARFESMRRWNEENLSPARPVELTPEQEEHLRALGYIE